MARISIAERARHQGVLAQIDSHKRRLKAQSQGTEFILPPTFPEFAESLQIKTIGGIKPFQLLKWQQQFAHLLLVELAEEKATVSILKSRQIGNTLVLLAIELWLSLKIEQHTTLCLHRTYADAHNLCKRLKILIKQLDIKLVSENLSRLEFPNGSTIYFRSADPETCGRGLESVDFLHIEEQSHLSDLKGALEVISPMRKWSAFSKLVMVGTPNGRQPYYFKLLCDTVEESTLKHTITNIRNETIEPYQLFYKEGNKFALLINWRTIKRFREESNPSFLERVKAEENLTEAGILSEYELEVTESESSVFSPVYIKNAEVSIKPVQRNMQTGETFYLPPDEFGVYFAGCDPNGAGTASQSYAAMVILQKIDGKFHLAYEYRKRTGTASSHISRWTDAIGNYDPLRTGFETNGTGNTWLNQICGLCVHHNFDGQKVTETTRPSMISLVQLALEQGDLSIPKKSPLISELLNFVVNENGRMEAAQGFTDDLIFAIAHALRIADYRLK